MNRFRLTLLTLSIVIVPAVAKAEVIDYDDLGVRSSFFDLGIANAYHGYTWGTSLTGGAQRDTTGWASAITADPPAFAPPTPVSGNGFAWNWNGPQSLFVDFHHPRDVGGAYFAQLSSTYPKNSSTVQLFGYDASNNLIASGGVLNLTANFQFLAADFNDVSKLEIRSDRNDSWFSTDNLTLKDDPPPTTPVPEPTSLLLFGIGAVGVLAAARRSAKH